MKPNSNLRSYRQGDIMLIEVNNIPKIAVEEKINKQTIVLAEGEATGHAHKIDNKNAALFIDKKKQQLYIILTQPNELIHDEHGKIDMPIGKFKVIRKREYTPEAIRTVLD